MFLDQIKRHLAELSVVDGSTGWLCRLSDMPSTPDKVVVLYETPGDPPDVDESGAVEYDEPGLQVRVRGEVDDYAAARNKIQDVFEALHENEPTAMTGETIIVYLYATQSGPLPMGKDSNNRPELVWNFRVKKQREA